MHRSVSLSLKDFPVVPDSLRINPVVDVANTHIDINLASLFHHYYLDCYGVAAPDPDPSHFEHLKFLSTCRDFRFRDGGLGVAPGIMGNRSQELGQAFCRYFLHDHLEITHFAHMHEVLDRQMYGPFEQCKLVRTQTGDAPDYLCTKDHRTPYLAEAKGRYSSVSFANKDFQSWRDQFNRVEFRNSTGELESLKGYIVATRFATEKKPRVVSGLFAEDPNSPGERPLNERAGSELAQAVIGLHYGRIAEIITQPILAASLRTGFIVPEEILFPAVVWELQLPPLKGMRFVGGYFPNGTGVRPIQADNGPVHFVRQDQFRLGVGNGTFFGLEEKIFRQLVAGARGQTGEQPELAQLPLFPPFYSAISILRDGSILAPIEFLRPMREITY